MHLKDMRPARGYEVSHIMTEPAGRLLTGSVIGEGLVDLAEIRAVMDSAGYDGWWSLEYEGGEEPLEVGVPRSLAAARVLLG